MYQCYKSLQIGKAHQLESSILITRILSHVQPSLSPIVRDSTKQSLAQGDQQCFPSSTRHRDNIPTDSKGDAVLT